MQNDGLRCSVVVEVECFEGEMCCRHISTSTHKSVFERGGYMQNWWKVKWTLTMTLSHPYNWRGGCWFLRHVEGDSRHEFWRRWDFLFWNKWEFTPWIGGKGGCWFFSQHLWWRILSKSQPLSVTKPISPWAKP